MSDNALSELDQFLETPDTKEAQPDADTGKQDAPDDATTETNAEEGKGEQPNAETPSAEQDESTAKADESKKPHWSETAYLDEKRKRQEYEAELAELRKQKADDKQDPDVFSDPDGYTKAMRDEIQNVEFRTKVNISVAMMRKQHADYDDAEKAFVELAQADPSLVTKMRQAALPAEFVYDTVARHKAMEEIGDPVKYREKLKQEILAELEATPKDDKETTEKPPIEKTPSLATASAAASNTSVTTPNLEELFER